MKYVLYAVLAWLAYQLIFNLIIPVYRASRKIKKGFREMHDQMNQQYQQQQENQSSSTFTNKTSPKAPSNDYIDFEEIK